MKRPAASTGPDRHMCMEEGTLASLPHFLTLGRPAQGGSQKQRQRNLPPETAPEKLPPQKGTAAFRPGSPPQTGILWFHFQIPNARVPRTFEHEPPPSPQLLVSPAEKLCGEAALETFASLKTCSSTRSPRTPLFS